MPLVGRMYEVQAAQELELQNVSENETEGSLVHREATTDTKVTETGVAPRIETTLPFIGSIVHFDPGESIIIERVLDLREDLFLADHSFVHAQEVKPLSACLPVLPMTFSLEVMSEVAACLIPNHGLIGLENIKATRWIELADTDHSTLQVSASQVQFDAPRHLFRVQASIHIDGQSVPAISAEVLFATQYQVDLQLAFTGPEVTNHFPAERIYRERQMFHGPTLHCLCGEIQLGEHAAIAELMAKPADKLFASIPEPQLLLDPVLLDGVGQLLAVWAMEQRQRSAFPIGFKKLELYRSTPPPNTRVPIYIEITRDDIKTLHADIEIQDGEGAVWMRILDWSMWKFRWPQKILDFRRLPTQYLVSDIISMPFLPKGACCRTVADSDLAGFDLSLLARYYLHMNEWPSFAAKAEVPKRQRQWLSGRIAVKDAVRRWIAEHQGNEMMLHPASFSIINDETGRPSVKWTAVSEYSPEISIAHCEQRAIAIAHHEPTGVDIEPVASRNGNFIEMISKESERNQLNAHIEQLNPEADPSRMDEWVTRYWCAKEAAGKLLGTGVNNPQRFEVVFSDNEGNLKVHPQGSDFAVSASTIKDDVFIIALAYASETLAQNSRVTD